MLFERLWMILTLKCEQAHKLQSDAFERDLKWFERAALRGHTVSCRVCRGVATQLRFLAQVGQASRDRDELETCSLSASARDRIQQEMLESDPETDTSHPDAP